MAKICDPLGLASPITLGSKLLYREVCDTKLSWDAKLPKQVGAKLGPMGGETSRTANSPKVLSGLLRGHSVN